MPGTKSHLTSLAIRKQLLLAESEVNRIQFAHDCRELAAEVREVTRHARSVCSSVASVASMGIAGFEAVKDMRSQRGNGKAGWFANVMNGLRVGTAMWKSFKR